MSVDSVLPVVYDPKARKWVSTRQYGQGTILHPLGSPKLHISAPITSALSGKNANGVGTLHVDRARKWSQYLMHDIPELAPALDILPDFIEESHIITASTEVNDPTVGRLMDVGSAALADDGDGQEGAVRTLIYATGQAGSEVGIGRIIEEEFKIRGEDGRERGEGVKLIAPGLDADRLEDKKREAPYRVVGKVRQVCTAKGNSPLLAIRTASSSTILTQEYTSHISKFTVTPLLTIPVSETPHSDLAFSPYNPRYLSIVDERGAWSVSDLHDSQSPKTIATGNELTNTPNGHHWSKIHWGADENSLIVSNRARVGLFDIRAQHPGLSFLPINTSATRDWVLDTAHLPTRTNPHHAIILTSSSLLWIDTRMPGKRLLSQDHFRHSDDVSLKMELFSLPGKGGKEVTALVYSRMNLLVSAFQMGYSEGEGAGKGVVPMWLDNPYLWKMDMGGKGKGKSGGLLSLSILPTRIGMDDDKGSECNGRKVVGVSCWSYEREGEIRSRIYTSEDMGESIPIYDYDHDNAQEPHTCLVGEGDNADMEQPPWNDNKPRLLHTDLSPLYKYIFTDTFSDPTLKTADGESAIEDFGTQLQQLLLTEDQDADGPVKEGGVKTLFDIHRPQHLFDDLSGLSTSLKTLLSETNVNKDIEVTRNLIPISEGFPFRAERVREDGEEEDDDKADNDILSLYNHLFTSYVAPLPPEVPTRVRLHRERLARMIATELYLASHGTLTTLNLTINPGPTTTTPEQTPTLTPDVQEQPPPLFATLKKYTSLTNHPPPSTLPSSLSRILGQWPIGEDPEDFEYEANGAPTPQKARTKLSRSRSRGEKGMAGAGWEGKESGCEGDAGRRVSMFSGSRPVMFAVSAATQPTTPSRGLYGVGGGGVPQTPITPEARTQSPEKMGGSMSQVERGKFGGRKRPPKKRRKQGF
ncbi:RNA polymerase I-specific transcription-initiation factor-domain-containing protein [Tirmania nivea]|nr:RNA polymerase I-specific transcription-initiation factor-domain-containing protein [Tirmania nivea]